MVPDQDETKVELGPFLNGICIVFEESLILGIFIFNFAGLSIATFMKKTVTKK